MVSEPSQRFAGFPPSSADKVFCRLTYSAGHFRRRSTVKYQKEEFALPLEEQRRIAEVLRNQKHQCCSIAQTQLSNYWPLTFAVPRNPEASQGNCLNKANSMHEIRCEAFTPKSKCEAEFQLMATFIKGSISMQCGHCYERYGSFNFRRRCLGVSHSGTVVFPTTKFPGSNWFYSEPMIH